MFCREIFGKKPKSLEFGLQPHKIPDSDTVGQFHFFHFLPTPLYSVQFIPVASNGIRALLLVAFLLKSNQYSSMCETVVVSIMDFLLLDYCLRHIFFKLLIICNDSCNTRLPLCGTLGIISDALFKCPLCPVSSSSGQGALLHQAQRTPRPAERSRQTPRSGGN